MALDAIRSRKADVDEYIPPEKKWLYYPSSQGYKWSNIVLLSGVSLSLRICWGCIDTPEMVNAFYYISSLHH